MDLTDYEVHADALHCFNNICKRSLERDGIGGVTRLDAASTIESGVSYAISKNPVSLVQHIQLLLQMIQLLLLHILHTSISFVSCF